MAWSRGVTTAPLVEDGLPAVPLQVLARGDVRAALAEYHVAKLISIVVAGSREITHRTVGAVIGYHPSSVSRIVNGHDRITDIHRIRRIVVLLGIPAEFLGGGVQTISALVGVQTQKGFWDGAAALTVEDMSRFVSADWSRRSMLSALPLATGAALVEPLRGWAHARPGAARAAAGEGMLADEVARMEAAVVAFRTEGFRYGGGLYRRAVVGQLSEVVERLERGQPPATARRLSEVAAQLAHLAGWMARDMQRHGLAQRYYIHALRLTREAANPGLGAEVLAVMARQMLDVGRPSDALELVRLAQYGVGDRGSPALESMLATVKARALAQIGDTESVRKAIAQASESFEESRPTEEPSYIRYFDRGELDGVCGLALCELADPQVAEQAAEISQRALRARPPESLRSRQLDLAKIAKAHVLLGEPVEAVRVGQQALEMSLALRSGIVITRLSQIAALAEERFSDLREVREFGERVRALPKPG
jgi:tetratricopeptide (TPR) repeat protein/plasmid maintenance system antidote protein VapI